MDEKFERYKLLCYCTCNMGFNNIESIGLRHEILMISIGESPEFEKLCDEWVIKTFGQEIANYFIIAKEFSALTTKIIKNH